MQAASAISATAKPAVQPEPVATAGMSIPDRRPGRTPVLHVPLRTGGPAHPRPLLYQRWPAQKRKRWFCSLLSGLASTHAWNPHEARTGKPSSCSGEAAAADTAASPLDVSPGSPASLTGSATGCGAGPNGVDNAQSLQTLLDALQSDPTGMEFGSTARECAVLRPEPRMPLLQLSLV